MNYLFFTSPSRTHIIPIKELFKHLICSRKDRVYVLGEISNKEIIEEYGGVFIEYPFDVEKGGRDKEYQNDFINFWNQKEYTKGYDYFLKNDARYINNISPCQIDMLVGIARKKNIDFIFRDAFDKYGRHVAVQIHVPEIGYITHNLYSSLFFRNDPELNYKIFMNGLRREEYLPVGYFESFEARIENAYNEVNKKAFFEVFPLNQFDPRTEYTLICSHSFFQPSKAIENRKVSFLMQDQNYYEVSDNSDNDVMLVNFLTSCRRLNKKVVYVATGSIITHSLNFYIQMIELFENIEYSLVIACKNYTNALKKIIEEKKISSKVYVAKNVNQNLVLSYSSVFVTHAGQNSILESIFHKCPMLCVPLTSEQRLNSHIIEELGLGFSYYENETKFTFKKLLDILISNSKYKENLKKYSATMKTDKNDFSKLDSYIERKTR